MDKILRLLSIQTYKQVPLIKNVSSHIISLKLTLALTSKLESLRILAYNRVNKNVITYNKLCSLKIFTF